MNRSRHHEPQPEVVRLSVGNWIVLILAGLSIVAAIIGHQIRTNTDTTERLTRVETRVEQLWQHLISTNKFAGP